MEQVLDIPTSVWGNAVDYWTNPNVLALFDKVSNPQDGDIGVYGNDAGNWTGPEGHIFIRYGGQMLNQNYNGSLKVSINPIFAPGFLGYLRVKGATMANTIPNADNYYGRYNKAMAYIRARDIKPGAGFPRDEFNVGFVGRTDLTMLEAMLDDAEADQAHEWMRLGYLASKDNWQQQIYDLQAANLTLTQERNAARDELAPVKTSLSNANAQIADLKAQLASQTDDTKNLNAAGIALQWLIKRLGITK
jgi:hypothetical protein